MKATGGVRGLVEILFLVLFLAVGASPIWAEDSGAETFKSKCVLCHGADGTGNTPLGKQLQAANLHSKEVQSKTNAELHKIVHDGKTNMPPFADQLSDEQITQVVKYVRSFGKAATK